MSVPANVRLKQVYKGVNIYRDVDDHDLLVIVYKKHEGFSKMYYPKSLQGAKAWISRNKTFNTFVSYMPRIVTTSNTVFY